MTKDEIESLKRGDVIYSKWSGNTYDVLNNYGNHILVSNYASSGSWVVEPDELKHWKLIRKLDRAEEGTITQQEKILTMAKGYGLIDDRWFEFKGGELSLTVDLTDRARAILEFAKALKRGDD